jgi:hypothetical protein
MQQQEQQQVQWEQLKPGVDHSAAVKEGSSLDAQELQQQTLETICLVTSQEQQQQEQEQQMQGHQQQQQQQQEDKASHHHQQQQEQQQKGKGSHQQQLQQQPLKVPSRPASEPSAAGSASKQQPSGKQAPQANAFARMMSAQRQQRPSEAVFFLEKQQQGGWAWHWWWTQGEGQQGSELGVRGGGNLPSLASYHCFISLLHSLASSLKIIPGFQVVNGRLLAKLCENGLLGPALQVGDIRGWAEEKLLAL